MQPIKVFTNRFPFLGPIIWILSIQYFIIQVLAAIAWSASVPYSWRLNTISDLGNTVCGPFNGRLVCTPLHTLMNLSLVMLGLIMASGSLLIYQEFRESKLTRLGFSLMALAGFGTILVGVFPENTNSAFHVLGAALPFLIGNISLVILSISLYKVGIGPKIYTFVSGFIPLVALVPFVYGKYGNLGIGGLERVIAYPQTIWLIFFGLYISRDHYLRRKRERQGHNPPRRA